MNLRFALLLVALFAVNACAGTVRSTIMTVRATDVLSTITQRTGRARCVTDFHELTPVAGTSVLLSIQLASDTRLVYEVAVNEERHQYPSPRPCYVEGDWSGMWVYFLVPATHPQLSVSVRGITWSERVTGCYSARTVHPAFVFMPQGVELNWRLMRTSVDCWESHDFWPKRVICEHQILPYTNAVD